MYGGAPAGVMSETKTKTDSNCLIDLQQSGVSLLIFSTLFLTWIQISRSMFEFEGLTCIRIRIYIVPSLMFDDKGFWESWFFVCWMGGLIFVILFQGCVLY
jgi:hypothetical protein